MSQKQPYLRRSSRRQGFTLIEILIAVGLFLVLLAVILVPLNQAFKVFNVGRSSIALQSAADNTVKTIAAELRGAVVVFPNEDLPGVTDRAPHQMKTPALSGQSLPPFFQNGGATCAEARRVGNPARIDFILPARAADGSIASPVKPQKSVITYFARRLDKTATFDIYSNPVVIYRAQTLYEDATGATVTKMNTGSTRYQTSGCNSDWLRQDAAAAMTKPAEPQIPTNDDNDDLLSLVSPRDMALNVRNPTEALISKTMQPDLNFACEDSDGNGVIDRVTISLTFVQYEEGGSAGKNAGQRVTATQIVNLSNARFGV